ncbi:MAG: glycoside hydrolase family 16 protein [Pyrinomonadaceae bacterium]|nr:glycoside hydrolase family 16 protein [Pyrinomonadaceae bacterium]
MKMSIFVFLLFILIPIQFENPEAGINRADSDDGYELVWSDEFRGSGSPDPAKWGFELGYVRNFEAQYYTNRKENVRIANGKLIIEARKERIRNNDFVSPKDKNWRKRKRISEYTSASVTTKGLAEWKYGKIEVRARLPKGVGAWSAIWMLGEDLDELDWVKSGEIDIMENVGFDPNVVLGTVHTEAFNYENGTERSGKIKIKDPHREYHDYAIEWTPGKIEFAVDGAVYYRFRNAKRSYAEWPFDQKFHLKINTAVGGTWGGRKGIDVGSFPLRMYIDYVRVYQKKL